VTVERQRPWNVVSDEIQFATWRAALVDAGGNVTRAAGIAGVARSHATRLNKKFALGEFAAELRIRCAGAVRVLGGERRGSVLGRPRKTAIAARSKK
jgi:hypothetical protein